MMETLPPDENSKSIQLWKAEHIALTTLVVGVITSFSWSILGGFLLAGINWVRMGKTRKALLNIPMAILFSGLFTYTSYGRVPRYLANPLPTPAVVIIYFTLAFVAIMYLHTQMRRDYAEFVAQGKPIKSQPSGLSVLIIFLGIPFFILLGLGNIVLFRAVGFCDIPSVYSLGTVINGPRFEGLASGLIQVEDFSCDWSWGISEVKYNDDLSQRSWPQANNPNIVDRVYHTLAGDITQNGEEYFFTIHHYLQRQTPPVTESDVQGFMTRWDDQRNKNLLSLTLLPHGIIQQARCSEDGITYCNVVVGYDHLISYFDVTVIAPPEVIEDVLTFLLTTTDERIELIDQP